MRKKRSQRGFRSNVGVTKEKGHNNGKASNLRRERNVLKGIMHDRKARDINPGRWRKAIANHVIALYEKIDCGRYIGEREDYELSAEATQVYCKDLVYINLWAVDNLIRTADTPELLASASRFHACAEYAVYRYGSQDDRTEWKRLGNVLLMKESQHPSGIH